MYKIDEKLYQGGEPEDWFAFDVEWAVVSLNRSIYVPQPACFNHLKFPIEDGPFPGIRWLTGVTNCIGELHEMGLNVYVHCLAGVSRSAMVTAAYLMKRYHLTDTQALDQIGKVNELSYPNPAFRSGLVEWGEHLARYR